MKFDLSVLKLADILPDIYRVYSGPYASELH